MLRRGWLIFTMLAMLGAANSASAQAPAATVATGSELAQWWRGYEDAPLIRLPDGHRLRLYCTGHGSPTIVLDSGLGSGAWAWRKLQPVLARTAHTCSYDRAGYGGSDPGPMPRGVDALASDLAQMLQASHTPGPYLVVGHSLGGAVARQFAYRHQKEIAGLVLVDPAADHQSDGFDRIDPAITKIQRDAYEPVRLCAEAAERGPIAPDSADGRACIGPPLPDMPADLVHFHVAYAQSPVHSRAILAEAAAVLDRSSDREADAARHRLGATPIVVLTADGTLDNPSFPAADRQKVGTLLFRLHDDTAHLSTRGEHRVIAHTGHFIQDDQPAAVLRAIADVLRQARAHGHPGR